MQGRNAIILLIAVVIGIVAVIIANSWFSGMQQRQEKVAVQQKLSRIVVATQPMEFGTKITPQMVRMQNWPADSVPQGAFTSIDAVLKDNRVALRPIVPNEPVLASKVSGTDGRATLAAVLPEGMHAYSIRTDATRGVSGFVLPGTMVDVLLTRKIDGDGAGPQDLRSDVILRNVEVLAADQMANDKEGKPKVSRNVTLATTLFDAQRLSIAEKVGTISLALRKVEDAAQDKADGVVRDAAFTVTDRQLGGRRMYIAKRREGPPPSSIPSARMASGPVSAAPAFSGPSMTVFRGTDPTIYPLGFSGGK
ncbi:Flp pilus assembly protein CpaB [Novosphingobium sp. ZN18A2]|uniref:Flp pilus assembly protein CpaB n=1 Tax=Novosphingobium sp. ZN18A2 TaxID=3079861 RepID=UPI0030D4DE10